MMICVGNTLKNVEVEMTPCFEKARFIECAKHLCDYEEDRAKRVLFQIFDELRDGFEYDAKFASSDDLYEIRTYIPQKFLRNDILVDYIVRRHIVGGANCTLISAKTPFRLCRTGTCRRLSEE